MKQADLMFTGGVTLFEFKKGKHSRIYPFPSGVDVPHFRQARNIQEDPADQQSIPHPRLGYAGVIDERFDIELIREAASLRPDWHFVLIGPVVKVDPAALPQADNIHYLGGKAYQDLPSYMAGWDAAILPFARNESTRFISPTKTPEYLAAGRPVVSTSITDVIRPYQHLRLVHIADEPESFVNAIEKAMNSDAGDEDWLRRSDEFLQTKSWDAVWGGMDGLIQEVVRERLDSNAASESFQSNQGAQTICSIS